MTQKFTLPASKRLKSQKQIAQLFATGQSHFIYPFKLLFLKEHMETQGESNVQFAVSVPKKKIKTAVERNLIKRRTRESYRLNSIALQKKNSAQLPYRLSIMLVYVENEALDYTIIEQSVVKHLNFLLDEVTD